MKKIIIILFLCLMITGCSANYNLTLKNNQIKEELIINNYNVSSWNEGTTTYKMMVEQALKSNIPIFYQDYVPENNSKLPNLSYYQISPINETNNLGLTYKYLFKEKEYRNSTLLNSFDHKLNISVTNNIISFNESESTLFDKYPSLDNLTLKIETSYKVIKNNADKVEGNTYYWYLNKEEQNQKSIIFKCNKSEQNESQKTTNNQTINIIYIIIIGFIILMGLLIYLKVKKASK